MKVRKTGSYHYGSCPVKFKDGKKGNCEGRKKVKQGLITMAVVLSNDKEAHTGAWAKKG